MGEWHAECFREYEIREQSQPYKCGICRKKVGDGEEIFYGVIGNKPSYGYKRPEARGYSLWLVVHKSCWS
jgi:hypothetical protein